MCWSTSLDKLYQSKFWLFTYRHAFINMCALHMIRLHISVQTLISFVWCSAIEAAFYCFVFMEYRFVKAVVSLLQSIYLHTTPDQHSVFFQPCLDLCLPSSNNIEFVCCSGKYGADFTGKPLNINPHKSSLRRGWQMKCALLLMMPLEFCCIACSSAKTHTLCMLAYACNNHTLMTCCINTCVCVGIFLNPRNYESMMITLHICSGSHLQLLAR